jgi:hypothetical protein
MQRPDQTVRATGKTGSSIVENGTPSGAREAAAAYNSRVDSPAKELGAAAS